MELRFRTIRACRGFFVTWCTLRSYSVLVIWEGVRCMKSLIPKVTSEYTNPNGKYGGQVVPK